MLSEEYIKKFHELYFTQFGVQLDKKEASEKAYKLFRFVQLIYRPMTKERFLLLKDYLEKTGTCITSNLNGRILPEDYL